jgi:hypothetical protein
VNVYRFIAAERATFGVKMLCRHLGVSTSAFYDWSRRPPSRRELDNRSLVRRIGEIHESSPRDLRCASDHGRAAGRGSARDA